MSAVPSPPVPACGLAPSLRRRRRGALGLCILVATLLNAGILVVGDKISGAEITPGAGPAVNWPRALFVVPPRKLTEDSPVIIRSTQVNAAPPAATVAAPRNTPPSRAKPAHQNVPSALIRFYRFSEVDTAAEPESGDWNLKPEALEKLGLQRLVFEILINDRGQVIDCTILDPPALAEVVRHELEGQLGATPMRPATRAGIRVASLRRIEMLLSEEYDPPVAR